MNKLYCILLVIIGLFAGVYQTFGTHVVGGSLTYQQLGPSTYSITLKLYRDCQGIALPGSVTIAVRKNNGAAFKPSKDININSVTLSYVPSFVDTCTYKPNVCVQQGVYTTIVNNLPGGLGGYHLYYTLCCRNASLGNLIDPLNVGSVFYARIPDDNTLASKTNSSPVFTNFPPIFICEGVQFNFDHSATDADGDSLVYSLYQPYDGGTNTAPNPPVITTGQYFAQFTGVPYQPGYSFSNPLGGSPLSINPVTGLLTGTPPASGQYVVGVKVTEYRRGTGQVLSATTRDFQFNVLNCPLPAQAIIGPSDICTQPPSAFKVTFNNQSTLTATTFFWDFGDPTTTSDTSSQKNPSYIYPKVGSYIVKLIVQKGSKCADSTTRIVNVSWVKAGYKNLPAQICQGTPVNFSDSSQVSSNTTIGSYLWSFGDGNTSNSKNPTYTYSSPGTYKIKLTVTNALGCQDTFSKSITVVYARPVVNAGPDISICQNNAVAHITGTVTGATGGIWSGGSGIFSLSVDSLKVNYIPSSTEISGLSKIMLVLSSSGNGVCKSTRDTVFVQVTPKPTIHTDSLVSVCANNPNVVLNGAVTVSTGGTWSGGTGTYLPNANTLNATYTPSSTEINNGAANLILTTTGNGNCTALTKATTISITPSPKVNPGIPQTVCSNNASVKLSGTVLVFSGSSYVAGQGTWTGGNGTFSPSRDSLNTTYTPTTSEIASGSLTISLQTRNQGNCAVVSAPLTVTFSAGPTANAGPVQTVCQNVSGISLNGQVTVATGGVWRGGKGTFSPDSTTLNATYIPSVSEIAAKSVTLTLVTTGNGQCNAVSSATTITFSASPTVNPGPNVTVCSNNPSVNLNGSVTVATGGIWSGGSGTFSPSNTSLNATYTPASSEISAGKVILTLTSTGNGVCNAVSNNDTITISPSPTVSPGTLPNVCLNNAAIQLNASVTIASGVQWNGGSGTFTPSRDSQKTTYSPSVTELNTGLVNLTLVTTGNGNCGSVSTPVNITFNPVPVVHAGSNQSLCKNNSVVQLNATISGASGGTWSGGTGTFSPNNTTLNAKYAPSKAELNANKVVLKLTSTGNGTCNPVIDSVTISFTPSPTANAGSDRIVCTNNTNVNLNGSVTGAAGGTWISGGGTFLPNANVLNPTYIPSALEIAQGFTAIALSTTGNGTCMAANDTLAITFYTPPVISNVDTQIVCINNPSVILNGSVTNLPTASIIWSGGTGTFSPSKDSLNPNYRLSSAELNAGTVTLTLTATQPGCLAVTQNATLQVVPAPVVNAGPVQSVCANNPNAIFKGSVTGAGGGKWTSSGTGSFSPNNTSLNVTYQPSAADILAGRVVLTLTSTQNGTCNAVSDTSSLYFTPAPTAVITVDTNQVCANNATIQLNGKVTIASGGTWSGGSGTYNPNTNSLNISYIPTSSEITAGLVKFTLTTTGNGNCAAVSAITTVKINPAPIVNAGNTLTVCANNPTVTLNGSVTNASGGIWTGGLGTFSPSASQLNAFYTLSNAEIQSGKATLTLISTGNGNCDQVSSSVNINVSASPSANAGSDQSICGSASGVQLNGVVTVSGGGKWTTSGTGTFTPNSTTSNAVYNPSTSDKTKGTVTLTYTTTSNGTCLAVSDQAKITFTTIPSINAGPDQTVCTNNLPVALNANGSPAQWTGGKGTFSPNANTLNATYQPTATEIASGNVILTVTTVASGACPVVSDNVKIAIPQSPVVKAGSNNDICADATSYNLNGTVNNATGGTWTTSGTGTFSPNATTLNASYVPSVADKTNGGVRITLTSTGGLCPAGVDTFRLKITPPPTVDAGIAQSVCSNNPNVQLNGVVTVATGATWTGGSGTYTPNSSVLNAVYKPTPTEINAGKVFLTLTTTGNGKCLPVSDLLSVTITPGPTVNAGSDQTICADSSKVTLNGKITVAGGAVWTTSGSGGTFSPNANDTNTVYYLSPSDRLLDTLSFTLTTTGNKNCNAVSDIAKVSINKKPVVNAGSDITACADVTGITLSGSVTNAGGGVWSGSGTGTFSPNSQTLNAQYIPSVQDIAGGLVVLTLTSTGNGLCHSVQDKMNIRFTPAPTVSAGPGITICSDASGAPLQGNITVATRGIWTSSGTGAFQPTDTSLHPIYVPSISDKSSGKVTITLTTTGNGTCKAVSSSTSVNITPVPTVNAGNSLTVCADTSGISLKGTVSNAKSGVWTTNGQGYFSPRADSLITTYIPAGSDLTTGTVKLNLTTSGNGSCNAVTDSLTITITPAPTANAGSSITVCGDTSGISLNGQVNTASAAVWSTSGNGSFTPSAANPSIYKPSSNDIAAGSVTLTLTTTGNGQCKAVSSKKIITINPIPTIQAGPDQALCADVNSVVLSGSVTVAAGAVWATKGSGIFSPNSTTLTPNYLPSSTDKSNGQVTLLLTSTGNGLCKAVTDSLVLSFAPAPTILAAPLSPVCADADSIPLSATGTVAKGVIWITSGTGLFSPRSDSTQVLYIPSSNDKALGKVNFTVTTTGNGTCKAVSTQTNLTILPDPVVNAGPDQSVCANALQIPLTGSVVNASGGIWSTSNGQGNFTNANQLNASFTPSAAEIAFGQAVITLTSTGNGVCKAVSDHLIINLQSLPVANPGPDITVCADLNSVKLNGTVTNATGGTWTTSGSGTFSPDANTLNASYRPSANDKTAGLVVLTLTTTGNGNCSPAAASFNLHITPVPVVTATPPAACSYSEGVNLFGTVNNALGGIWSSTGTGSFTPGTNALNSTYTPSSGDISLGTINLTFTSTGNGTCQPVSAGIALTVRNAPKINAGANMVICANNPNAVLSATTDAPSLVWKTTGTGTFSPDSMTANASYIPSSSDISNGTVTLTAITRGLGVCKPESGSVKLFITPAPTVNAGSDVTICADSAGVQLNGKVTVSSGGSWTGGKGTFSPDSNTLNAVYKPSASEISAGYAKLVLVTTGNGICNVVSDTLIITINPAPTLNPGHGYAICTNYSYLQLNANVTNVLGGTWSTTNGTGHFVPGPNNTGVQYYPSPADFNVGRVYFNFVTTGNGLCKALSDTTSMFIYTRPTVKTGVSAFCVTGATISLNGSVTPSTSSLWKTSGSGTFGNITSPVTTYTPSVADKDTGYVILVLFTEDLICHSVADTATIYFSNPPTANAGLDQTVCGNNATVTLAGSVTQATGGVWRSTGTGSFKDSTTLSSQYVPSASDIKKGKVTLYLTTTGNAPCAAAADSLVLTITPQSVINLSVGNACSNSPTVQLSSSLTGAGGIRWSTAGSGTFNDTTAANPVYTPSNADKSADSVLIRVKTVNNGLCNTVKDSIQLKFAAPPTVNAGGSVTICANQPTVGVTGASFDHSKSTGVRWYSTGSGTFNDTTALNPVYTLSAADQLKNKVALYVKTIGNVSSCSPAVDTFRITITSAPQVKIISKPICSNAASIAISGTVSGLSAVQWSVLSGGGSFNPSTSLNTTFGSPGGPGTVRVKLSTTDGTATCPNVFDTTSIQLQAPPTAQLGIDQSVCANVAVIGLTGTTNNSTGRVWKTNGTGTFSDTTSSNPNYIPSAADKVTGKVQFKLFTTGNQGCLQASDSILYTFQKPPSVSAGNNLSVCANQATINLNGSVSVAPSVNWTILGSGLGSLNNSSVTNPVYMPSSSAIAAGSVSLEIATASYPACAVLKDTIVITFNQVPVISTQNTTICTLSSAVQLSANTNAPGLSWTTSGSGIFAPSSVAANPLYIPSTADKLAKSITLTVTTTGVPGCLPANALVVLNLVSPPVSSAGSDITTCADAGKVTLNGILQGATGGFWHSSGTGTFADSASANTTYLFSKADSAKGSVTLALRTNGSGGCSISSDTIILTITPSPTITVTADAGACKNVPSIQLNSNITVATGVVWKTGNGTGFFSPDSVSFNPQYYLSTSDASLSSLNFTAATEGNGTCKTVSKTVSVNLTNGPQVLIGNDTSICGDASDQVIKAQVTGASGGVWSTSGTGRFSDSTSLNTSYTISAQDVLDSLIVIRFTSTGNGICLPVTAERKIAIRPVPVLNAGFAQTICANNPSIALEGTARFTSKVKWTTTGTGGSFSPSDTVLNAVYTPSLSDLAKSSLVFTINSTGNGTCKTVTSAVTVDISPAPIVSAGANRIICADADSINLMGAFSGTSGITWFSSGTGTFSPSTISKQSAYYPSASDIQSGLVKIGLVANSTGNCLTVTDTMLLTITPKPSVSIGAINPICASQVNLSLNAAFDNARSTGITWRTTGTGVFLPDSNTLNATYRLSVSDKAAGAVNFTIVTKGNGTCKSATASESLAIYQVPVIDAGLPQTICADATSAQLDGVAGGSATGGVWSTTGTGLFISGVAVLNPIYLPTTSDKTVQPLHFTLKSTGNVFCPTAQDSTTLTITPRPAIPVLNDISVCVDVTKVVLNTPSSTPKSVRWSTSGTGSFSPDPDTLNAVYIPSQADKNNKFVALSLTTTNTGVCTPSSRTMRVFFTDAPVLNANPALTACADNSNGITLNGTVTSPFGGKWITSGTGTFSPNDSTLKTTYFPSAADIKAGLVNFELNSTKNGTCNTASVSTSLTITSAPLVNAGPDVTVCAGESLVPLNGSVTVATGGVWSTNGAGSFPAGFDQLVSSYETSIKDTSLRPLKLYLTSTGNGSCKAYTDSLQVSFIPQPVIDTLYPKDICADAKSVPLNAAIRNAKTVEWTIVSGTGSFTPNAFTLNATYLPSLQDYMNGLVTLRLTTDDGGLCSQASKDISLIITNLPVANAGSDTLIACTGDTIRIAAKSQSNVTYMWSALSGTPVGAGGILVLNDVTATNAYVLKVTDNRGCSSKDTVEVDVVNPPALDLGPAVCLQPVLQLNAHPVPVGILGNYQWYRNDTLIADSVHSTLFAGVAGLYTIEYQIGNCHREDTVRVKPLPVINLLNKTICKNQSAPIFTQNHAAAATYQWYNMNGSLLSNHDTTYVSVSSDTSRFGVHVTQNGCTNADTLFITAIPIPLFNLNNTDACLNQAVTLNGSVVNTLPSWVKGTYNWSPVSQPDTTTTLLINPPASATSTTYYVSYTFDQCTGKDSSTVSFHAAPVSGITQRDIPFCFDSINYSVSIPLSANAGSSNKYQWYLNGQLIDSTQTINAVKAGEYVVTITNSFKCSVKDSILARRSCKPKIFIPDAFIPDGPDPLNQEFKVFGTDFTHFRMRVFNRWGEVIFDSENRYQGWDGMNKGEKMPLGVYPYIVTYEGNSPEYQGPYEQVGKVTIIR